MVTRLSSLKAGFPVVNAVQFENGNLDLHSVVDHALKNAFRVGCKGVERMQDEIVELRHRICNAKE